MTTFEQNPHDRLTRRCIHCGTPRHSHATGSFECPNKYRPESLREAVQALRKAETAGDQSAIFVARGEVQRLGGDPDAEYLEEADLERLAPLPVAYSTLPGSEDWVETEREP